MEALRRIREKLEHVFSNLEAVGSGEIHVNLKDSLKDLIENQEDEDVKQGIEAVSISSVWITLMVGMRKAVGTRRYQHA